MAKADGTFILIENFEEPVAVMNRATENWSAGKPVKDEHNLLLSLRRTLKLGEEIGWRPVRIQNNTMASYITHTVIRKIGPGRGAGLIDRLLYPLYAVLTRIEDRFGSRLPLSGKDTMVVFKQG